MNWKHRGDCLTKKKSFSSQLYRQFVHPERGSYSAQVSSVSTCPQTFPILSAGSEDLWGLKTHSRLIISSPAESPEIRSLPELHTNILLFMLSILKSKEQFVFPPLRAYPFCPCKREGSHGSAEALHALNELQKDISVRPAIARTAQSLPNLLWNQE